MPRKKDEKVGSLRIVNYPDLLNLPASWCVVGASLRRTPTVQLCQIQDKFVRNYEHPLGNSLDNSFNYSELYVQNRWHRICLGNNMSLIVRMEGRHANEGRGDDQKLFRWDELYD